MIDPEIEFDDNTRYQKIIFYQNFCHELTISMRTIWGNHSFSPFEKVEYMRAINEIMNIGHCRLKCLLEADYKIIDESVWAQINRILAQKPELTVYLEFALESAERVSDASGHLSIFIHDYT